MEMASRNRLIPSRQLLLPVLCFLSLGNGLATFTVQAADKAVPTSGAAPANQPKAVAAVATAMTKTGAAFKADDHMQAVLDQLGAMGGKPIEGLTPEEARRQPTPADAVMAVLKKQGKDTTPAGNTELILMAMVEIEPLASP